MKTSRGASAAILVSIAIVMSVAAVLYVQGFVRVNYPSRTRYPVRGIDVSHHQGEIDWPAVRADGFTFAYIKATEGADHRDSRFERNWTAAESAGLARGAYHFFRFCTPGDVQAENFLDAVPDDPDALAPAVDVEFVGNCRGWKSLDAVRRELHAFLDRVEASRGMRPILYVTPSGYERVVAGAFPGYALWVRSIFGQPDLHRDDHWLLWQFADRGRVRGVPTLVDLDALGGSRADLPPRTTFRR